MKKSLKLLAAGLVATTALIASASAASFDHCADMLKSMNLFQGTDSGYELDRAPTRAEAAAMLVRMLGKETAAKELTYTAPFTDVLGWQQPYVQYLYENKLTTGYTETTFNPDAKCDAKMYNTFLLRALGYSDANGADFTYDKSLDKAKEIGVIDSLNCDETNFLRDHVAALSYTALTVAPKDATAASLLEKLVAEGAVSADSAKPMLTLMTNYKEYTALNTANKDETKTSMDAVVNASASINGTNVLKMAMDMKIAVDMKMDDMNKSQIAMTGNTKIDLDKALVGEGEESSVQMPMNIYYTEGNYYMSDGTNKIKTPMDFNATLAGLGDLSNYAGEPFSGIISLDKSGTTYTVKYASGALSAMTDKVLASMDLSALGATNANIKIGNVAATVTTANGKMSGMDMTMQYTMNIEGQSIVMDMVMKMSNIKMGGDVTVTLPTDLNTYTAQPAA